MKKSKVDEKKFRARRTTVFKKAMELSTLCGTDVALVMYHRDDPRPDFWCSSNASIRSLLAKSVGVVINDDNSSDVIGCLGVEDLSSFDQFLADKLDRVSEKINLMTSSIPEEFGEINLDEYDFTFDDNLDDIDLLFDDIHEKFNLDDIDLTMDESELKSLINRALGIEEQLTVVNT